MIRKTFLTITAFVGLAVGLFALLAPVALMASKGVEPDPRAAIWVREVGVLILPLGVMAFLVRGEPDSRVLRSFFVGNALVHLGLFPIEIVAYRQGVITLLSGIVPNSILHVALCGGFTYFATTMRVPSAQPPPPASRAPSAVAAPSLAASPAPASAAGPGTGSSAGS